MQVAIKQVAIAETVMPSVDLRIAAVGGAAIGIGAFLIGHRFGRGKEHVVNASKSMPLAAPSEASGIDLWTIIFMLS